MDTSKPLATDAHSPQTSNTSYSTTLPPILSTTRQPTASTPPVLPSPSTLSIVPPNFPINSSNPTSEPQFTSTSPGSDTTATFQEKFGEDTGQKSESGRHHSDTEGSEPEGESAQQKPSGVNLSISNTNELRRLALESRESLEALAAKTHETTPGLIDNYESADDQSVSREALYNHYTSFCEKIGVHHVNSASFGKITIRIITGVSERNQLRTLFPPQLPYQEGSNDIQESSTTEPSPGSEMWHTIEFDALSEKGVSSGLPPAAITNFMSLYRAHCQKVYDLISTLVKQFWQELAPHYKSIANSPEVIQLITRDDTLLYDVRWLIALNISRLLFTTVLTPLPLATIQSIQDFAKQYEGWIVISLYGHSQQLYSKKLEVARTFTGVLTKLCSLNHLSQSAASIIQSKDQTTQMVVDWAKVDFESLREQAAIICQCGKTDLVQIMEIDIKQLLQTSAQLDQWASWVESICDKFIGENLNPEGIANAQAFVLKWSYFGSLVVRDLSIRSAQSFGSFQILKLFIDDYVYHLAQKQIAQATSGNIPPPTQTPLLPHPAPPSSNLPSRIS
ncbi:hypothetical protein K493DRAFT_342260 [Basidiobolus meristosporus CBS 931.73]|uniref:Uncharacterized protein n=1 Tax=Basidiobolus meristosporus CBS 931.73 TaxID=1314790 RepID=A0A1Y1X8G9_9FUNG|nr:hypothetical protein K493DRAFT_342260 [Basidiobolus meristosporus CBS 931.73]|eukprot:ORX82037.1 hypothetical protein K493DRAFT_342260 [Basidiobolus meristosporus CBS 931.73]